MLKYILCIYLEFIHFKCFISRKGYHLVVRGMVKVFYFVFHSTFFELSLHYFSPKALKCILTEAYGTCCLVRWKHPNSTTVQVVCQPGQRMDVTQKWLGTIFHACARTWHSLLWSWWVVESTYQYTLYLLKYYYYNKSTILTYTMSCLLLATSLHLLQVISREHCLKKLNMHMQD